MWQGSVDQTTMEEEAMGLNSFHFLDSTALIKQGKGPLRNSQLGGSSFPSYKSWRPKGNTVASTMARLERGKKSMFLDL